MPRVNIYIRKEDYEAWKSIEAKPQFIHMSIVNYGLMGDTAQPPVVELAEKDYQKWLDKNENTIKENHGISGT